MTDDHAAPAAASPATGERIRTFFALVPDEATRLQFVALARDIARRSRGRAITGEHVHLTLAFLGDVDAALLPLMREIGDALPRAGADLEFKLLGAWRASGVAWVAPTAIPPPLAQMCAALQDSLQLGGFALDARPFRPHVTLARRCAQPQPRGQCVPIRWRVDRLCLIGSELRPEGPRYMELAAWALPVT